MINLSYVLSIRITITSLYLDPPSSPVVTLSQSDIISCSNVLMWFPPPSDRSITAYYIFRDGGYTRDVSSTTTEYTDSDNIEIDTVYTYSVVAASCAGNSTAVGVDSPRIVGELCMSQ